MPAKSFKRFFGLSNKPKSSGRKTSKELEKMLADYTKNYNKVIQILLLGSGESGKTTIIKQMKILHVQGFSNEERLEARQIIRDNMYECITTLVKQMARLKIPLGNKSNLTSWSYIQNMAMTNNIQYTASYFEHIRRLWDDSGVQVCFSRASEFVLPDCCKYFLDRTVEVADPNFIPSDQFLLHARKTTIGIQKIEFEVPIPKKFGGGGQQKFWMFDVGGQKGERRKWIQVFDGIQTILFLAACNTFDQITHDIDEDSGESNEQVNRLQEAIDLFRDVWRSRFLRDAGFIVFLNKQDLLKQKVESGKCIGTYFPDYYGYQLINRSEGDPENEYIRTRCFIRDLFNLATDLTPPSTPRKSTSPVVAFHEEYKYKRLPRDLYFHFTTATDTNNVQRVFEDVHSMILNKNLIDIGFA